MADHDVDLLINDIEIGDFIRADKDIAVFGIVTGEGSIGCVPAWRVDMGGRVSVMLKAYAVLIHKGETDGD